MKRAIFSRSLVVIIAAVCGAGCGPRAGERENVRDATATRLTTPGGLTLRTITRDGDPQGAIALAVITEGATNDESAKIAAALGGAVFSRIKKRAPNVSVAIGLHGYRIRAFTKSPDEARAFIATAGAALVDPITDEDLAAAKERLHLLAARPLATASEAPLVACLGESRAFVEIKDPDVATLEAYRATSHVRAHVAFAVVGPDAITSAVPSSLAQLPRLADGAVARAELSAPSGAMSFESDSTETAATATIARFFPRASDALLAAERIDRSPLRARLDSLDLGAHVRLLDATALPRGGCLAVSVAIKDLGKDPAQNVAAATVIAFEELALVAGAEPGAPANDSVAERQPDPRDAADAAAWLALSRDASGAAFTFTRVALSSVHGVKLAPADADAAITKALDARTHGVVEARSRVERGQGELYVLLGSPCGTMTESNSDAGIGVAALNATLPDAPASVSIEPIVLPDILGVLVHGPALPGESPGAHARRLTDVAARSLLGEPISDERARRALRMAFNAAEDDTTRALAALASEAAPSHLSWLVPQGSPDALGRAADRAVLARIAALRAGPLRVAVLANADADQAKAAALAADRFIAVRSSDARVCEPVAPPEAARPGTYAATRVAPGSSEAFFATQVPDARSFVTARALAALVDGPDGMLAKALSSGLARGSSVRILGSPRSASFVVRITTADGALDAAVAQVRALFARLAHGAITDDDAKHAIDARTKGDLEAALDPRNRIISLFRDPNVTADETPDAIRALAAAMFKDDAWVILALRPKTRGN